MNPSLLLQRLPLLVLGLAVLAVVATAGISRLEERDAFCTGCHLAPELTYHERSLAAATTIDPFALPDMASYHYWQAAGAGEEFRCIDCHRSDESISHRASVLWLATLDTVTYLRGQADETVGKGAVANPLDATTWPGPEAFNREPDILNAGCRKCHQQTLTLVGFDNHFHNRLPAARLAYAETGELHYPPSWPAGTGSERLLQADDTVLTCLDCHRAHAPGFESEFFLDQQAVTLPACIHCHRETGRGPLDLVAN